MRYVLTEEEWRALGDNRAKIQEEERAALKVKHDAMLREWRDRMTELFHPYLTGGYLENAEIRRLVRCICTASEKLKLPE